MRICEADRRLKSLVSQSTTLDGEPVDLQDHHLILALIATATVLGLAVGYCVEVLRSSSRESKLFAAWEQERRQLNADVEKQRTFTQAIMSAERKKSAETQSVCDQALARRDALQQHADVQSKQIANIEVELRAAEEQNLKLQSEFASYKVNKDRELQALRSPQYGQPVAQPGGARVGEELFGRGAGEPVGEPAVGTQSLTAGSVTTAADSIFKSPPILSKRVETHDGRTGSAPVGERLASRLSVGNERSRASRKPGFANAAGFSSVVPGSEIPTLAESELPGSADESDIAALLGDEEGVLSSG